MKKIVLIALMSISIVLSACTDRNDDDQQGDQVMGQLVVNSPDDTSVLEGGDFIGSSFENPIVVVEEDPQLGVAWEYDWLNENACLDNDGYEAFVMQALIFEDEKPYDLMTVKCGDGMQLEYHFLIDAFFGNY